MANTGGVLSLWKGHSTTIVRVAPYAGLCYAAHDYFENQFKAMLALDKLPGFALPYALTHTLAYLLFLSPVQYKFLAGSLGGAFGTLVTYPLDVLRVRLALIPNSTWTSSLNQGGLFQGLTPTMIGIIPYSGTSWMVKQTLHEVFPTVTNRKPTMLESLILNTFAGLSAQLATYPLDIVRRRMQLGIVDANEPSPTTLEMVKLLVKKEGLRGLTKGFSLNIIKGPITLSLSLTTYDHLRAWINRKRKTE